MKRPAGRPWVLLLVAAVMLTSAGAGVAAYRWSRDSVSRLPEISVYSRGQTARVGPYFFCNVVNLDDCARGGTQGALRVDDREPVQLSVPESIARAPWRLLKVYEDERDATATVFRPGARLAATIPTMDAQRGQLVGVVVQLMTLVRDQNGAEFQLPHAEWSVRLQRDAATT